MRTTFLVTFVLVSAACGDGSQDGRSQDDQLDEGQSDRLDELAAAIELAASDDRLTFDEADQLVKQAVEPTLTREALELVHQLFEQPPADVEEFEEDGLSITAAVGGVFCVQQLYFALPRDIEVPAGAGHTFASLAPLSSKTIFFGGDIHVDFEVEGKAQEAHDLVFRIVETRMSVHIPAGQSAEQTARAIASRINQQRSNISESQFGRDAIEFTSIETFLNGTFATVESGRTVQLSTELDS